MRKEKTFGDRNSWIFPQLPMLSTKDKLHRFKGVQFIKYLTSMLHFRENVAGCAALILNRYYTRCSDYSYIYDIAAASFLLSSKMNDSHCSVSTLAGLCAKETFKTKPNVDAEKIKLDWEASIYHHEEKILITLCYDLQFPNAYVNLDLYARKGNVDDSVKSMAKTILGDSYNSDLCVRRKTSLLASACIYMAGEALKKPVEKAFYSYVGYDKDTLKPVADEIEAFYDFVRINVG